MTKDLTKGSPMRLILSFGIPVLFGYLFQQLYNVVDTAIVGKTLGGAALAAVGSTGSINFLVVGFCAGTCGGSRNLVAERSALNRAGHKGYPKEYSGSIRLERVLFHSVENSLKTSGPKKPRKHKSTLPGCQL